jgi:hypothetical protein
MLAVNFTQDATNVYLNNGIVTATVTKSDGGVKDFRVGNGPNLMRADRGLYWAINATPAGGSVVWSFMNAGRLPTVTVTRAPDGSQVDVKLVNDKMDYNATTAPNGWFGAELHIILRDGEQGLYTYHVLRHNALQPEVALTLDMHQLRASDTLFTTSATHKAWSFAAGQKEGLALDAAPAGTTNLLPEVLKLPKSNWYTTPEGATDAEGFPKYDYNDGTGDDYAGHADDGSPTWSKYDWHTFEGPTTDSRSAFGDADDSNGIWFIQGSQEFYNGGPTKQKATVSGNLLYADFTNEHGLGDTGVDDVIGAGEVFEKVVGPVFIYGNRGTGHDNLWADAQARGAAEVARFPNYPWMGLTETQFPLTRGSVTGTLSLPDGSPAKNAQLILGDGSSGVDWQLQGYNNFLFWNKSNANGNFTISKVRPGTYTLYAYVPGQFGEFQKANVVVTAGGATDIGVWRVVPAQRKTTIFQVGTPDRSTAEFKYGDKTRQFGLWWHYMAATGGADLNFTPGVSNPATDWYYAQMIIPTGTTNMLGNGTTPGTTGGYRAPKWNINFNVSAAQLASYSTTLTLTVDLAGSMGTAFYVDVNGSAALTGSQATTGVYTTDDNGVYRNAVQSGRFQHFEITFPKSKLVAGANKVTFRLRAPGGAPNEGSTWTGTPPVIPTGGIMYDSIKLESGAAAIVGDAFPLTPVDIGGATTAGSTSYVAATGVYTLGGVGTDIFGVADQFHFAYEPLSGDGTIAAKVVSQAANTASWPKDGVMFRESLAANSPFIDLVAGPTSRGIAMQWRDLNGTTGSTQLTTVNIPVFLKLTRAGDTFTASYSTDGSTWTVLGTKSIAMSKNALAGLAASSSSPTATIAATFSNVSITSASPQITSADYLFNVANNRISVTFNKDVSASLATGDVEVFAAGSSTAIVPTLASYDPATNVAVFTLPAPLGDGNYQIRIAARTIIDAQANANAASATDFFVLAGDANRDRTVDFADLVILSQNYNLPGKTFSEGNFDYSAGGTVDFQDLVILSQRYNLTLAPPAPLIAADSGKVVRGKRTAAAIFA